MPDFSYSSQITINAPAQKIFDFVSNPANHAKMAGSEELNKITQEPAGAVGLGTHIMAEETVMLADGTGMDVTADSIVVTFDVPKSFSFIVNPVFPEQVRRIQWWFNLSAQGDNTILSHEVEVDWGNLTNEMMIGLRDNYEQIRAGVVRSGMDKTVANLKSMIEG
jgi:hypothetical protein